MEKKEYLKAVSALDSLEMELLQLIRNVVHNKKTLLRIDCGFAPDFITDKKEMYQEIAMTQLENILDFVVELGN